MKNLNGVMITESLANQMIETSKQVHGENYVITNEELNWLLSDEKIMQLFSKIETLKKETERLTNIN